MLLKYLRVIAISLGRFFECFFALIVLYFIFYWSLSRVPVSGDARGDKTVTIYVTSNGVHSDFVVPIVNNEQNWGSFLGLTENFNQDTTKQWIAIGWGDKNFFLKTKDWGDLTVGTALKATFGLGTGAVHIVQIPEPDVKNTATIKIKISKENYNELVSYIKGEFRKKGNSLSQIKEHPYSEFNFFFDAERSYSCIYTCNSWTNSGLKASHQKACLWTPFKDGIYEKYGK